MIVESALALTGLSVKVIYSLWATQSISGDVFNEGIDLVGRSIQSIADQRRTRRQLEAMADTLTDKLAPLLQSEFRGLDEAEKTAAVEAVRVTLSRARLDAAAVVRVNFEAAALERVLREADPGRASAASLNEPGTALYDTLIAEITAYITAIAAELPNFETAQARELLSRESALQEMSARILSELPSSPVPLEWGFGDADSRFETAFIRAVKEQYGRLELYGISSLAARPAYDLSLAYISLEVAASPRAISPSTSLTAGTRRVAVDEQVEDQTLKVERLLEREASLFITGDAGSGKTTLLRWIALNAIATLSAPAASTLWDRRVPFVIALRRYVEVPLPQPENFPSAMIPGIGGAMPTGWVHRVLAGGRGLLLIDGLDEIPAERREEVFEWLQGLRRIFPDAPTLVTSRATAVAKSWLQSGEFFHAELQPMEYPDIKAFVEHWHTAYRSNVDADEYSLVEEAQRAMLQVVRGRPSLRALCTSPLLAALLCALNLYGGGRLPQNRMELYGTALEMLVTRRDDARRIGRTAGPQPSERERFLLLRAYALWLHENGLADSTREEYEHVLARTLPSLHQLDGSAEEVGRFLLERCGILREPVTGRVDFVHRSFLEYLAAAALIDEDSVAKLVLRAPDDTWRDVIVMAAGHANATQRDALITGLLDRGEDEPANLYRCFILAVACMETTIELPTSLRNRLDNALGRIVPPTTMTDAASVASAGPAAAPLLVRDRGGNKLGVWEAVASVRALSLIGGDEALEALKTYSTENRVTVNRQLLRAWSSFDLQIFAEEVLRHNSLIRRTFKCEDVDQLPTLQYLEQVDELYLDLAEGLESWEHLAVLEGDRRVKDLRLRSRPWLESFAAAPNLPDLTAISLWSCSGLRSVDGVQRYGRLTRFQSSGTQEFADYSALSSVSSLRELHLSGTGDIDLTWLSESDIALESLVISGFSKGTLQLPAGASVVRLSLWGVALEGVVDLTGIDLLTSVDLERSVDNIAGLVLPETVRDVELSGDSRYEVVGGEGVLDLVLSAMSLDSTAALLAQFPNCKNLEFSLPVTADNLEELMQVLSRQDALKTVVMRRTRLDVSQEIPGWRARRSRGAMILDRP